MNKRVISKIMSFIMCMVFACNVNIYAEDSEETTILEALNNASGIGQFRLILGTQYRETLENEYDFDYVYYDKLGNYQGNVCSILSQNRPFNTLADLGEAFYSTCEERYVYYNRTQLTTLIREIDSGEASDIKTDIEGNSDLLCLDMTYYNAMEESQKTFVCEFLRDQTIDSIGSLRAYFSEAVLVARINSVDSADALLQLINENEKYLELDYTEYNELKDFQKEEVLNRLMEVDYTDLEGFRNEFYQKSEEKYNELTEVLDYINNAGDWSEIEQVINDKNDILELDFTYYDMLEQDLRENVLNIIICNDYASIDDFRSDFYNISEEVYNDHQNHKIQELIDRINNAEPQEIKLIIEENHSILGLDMEYYNGFSDEWKSFVCELMHGRGYTDVIRIQKSFEEAVLLARINNSPNMAELRELVEENREVFGSIRWEIYDKLSKQDVFYKKLLVELTVCRLKSIEHFCDVFNEIVHEVYRASNVRPSGGGGGGSMEVYVLNSDKQKIETEPETGTAVKMVVRAVYQDEPLLTYMAAVHDSEGRLVSVKPYESKATKENETEFFEFDAKYDPEAEIKLFRLESLSSLKPLDDVGYEGMVCGKELPEPEEETEGIVAVKGSVGNEYDDYFELTMTDMRAFGYWGIPCSHEPVKVYYTGTALDVYRMIGIESVIYNLKENGDGSYTLDSVETEGELIHFSGADIVTYDETTLTVLVDGKEVLYQGDNAINFMYEDLTGEYYYAYLSDGKIEFLYSYNYDAFCVASASGGKIVLTDGMVVEDADAAATLESGDVICIYKDIISKAEAVKVTYADGYVTAGEKKYYLNFANIDDFFNEGEECIAYLDPEGNHAKYLKKDYENREFLIVSDVFADELTGISLLTQNGVKKISQNICFNGEYIDEADFAGRISGMLPCMMYICEVGEFAIIDSADMLTSIKGQYNSTINAVGGYTLTEGRMAALVDGEIYTDITLTDGVTYQLEVYSFDGINADFILFIDAQAAISEYNFVLVRDVLDNAVSGYSNGEEVLIEYDVQDMDICAGDMIVITSVGGTVKSIEKIMPQRYMDKAEYVNGTVMYLPVSKTFDDCVIMANGDTYYTMEANDDTYIYEVNVAEGTIKEATIGDIYYNPIDTRSGDWVLVKRVLGTDAAQFVVIYKEM